MLNVKCPSCSKQFKVGEEFFGKHVECGSCEYQFSVIEQYVSRKKERFYHESKDYVDLTGFKKSIEDLKKGAAPSKKKVVEHNPQDFFPAEDWRIYTRITATAVIIIAAFFLYFGSQENSFLTDSPQIKRIIFAAFFTVVSFILFYFGFRKKGKSFLFGALAGLLLIGMVFILPQYENPSADISEYTEAKNNSRDTILAVATSETVDAKIKRISGYTPVKNAILRAATEGDENAASIAAIWIEGAQAEYKYDLQDYFKKILNLEKRPYYYERKAGALILINTLEETTLQEVSKTCLELGIIKEIYPKLRLISLDLNESKFTLINKKELSNVLSDDSKKEFYTLNIKELSHFDDKRIADALERLLVVEQIRYQDDVCQALVNLVSPSYSFEINELAALCLSRWATNTEKWKPLIETTVRFKKRTENNTKWAPSLINLLLDLKIPEIETELIKSWAKDPTSWETLANKLSAGSAPRLLKYVSDSDKIKALSSLRILGNIGTQATINSLRSMKPSLNSELHIPVENAIREIKFTL